jgi:hypothetical protein
MNTDLRTLAYRAASTDEIGDAAWMLVDRGAAAQIVPSRRRGFDWAVSIPGCIQHMTDAQLVEFAANEHEMRR